MYLTHKTYLQSILVETPFNPRPKALKMTKNGGEMGCFSRMKCKHSAQNFSELLFTQCYCSPMCTVHRVLFTDTITGYCLRHYSRIVHGVLFMGTVHSAVKKMQQLYFFSCLNRSVNLLKYTRGPRDLN